MYNGGLNKIIKENSDKLKYSPKGITTGLPESSWLDKYKMGGGLYTRKVTCSRCGHSWKGVDGGEDPMTCHKCGGMIKMKNGGPGPKKPFFPVKNFAEPNYVAGQNPEGRYGYSDNTIWYDPNSEIENVNNPWWKGHEQYHHYQTLTGKDKQGQRDAELDAKVDDMIRANPELQFVPRSKLVEGSKSFPGAEVRMYEDPNTVEGGARAYEQYIENGGKSIFPKQNTNSKNNYNTGSAPLRKNVEFKNGGEGPGDDEAAFQQFFKTLPLNLRKDSPDYNIRGYWNGLGRPTEFDYSQPKEDDGYYHATSRNPQTGEILKAPFHPTFKQAISEDRKAGYFPIVTPDGKIKTVSGNDLKPGQSVYANGGDISIPNVYPNQTVSRFDEGGLVGCPPGQVWSEKLKKCVDSRGFWNTFSQFVPGYETYLDVKDVVQGATTGNTAQKNQGIIGLAQPVAGKAVTNLLDYVTEKLLGKDVADEIAERRQGVVNMSDKERIALFKKYGFGGYEKWVKDGKPPLYELGGGTGPYSNFPSTGMLTRNVTGPKVPTMKNGGEPWTAKYKF